MEAGEGGAERVQAGLQAARVQVGRASRSGTSARPCPSQAARRTELIVLKVVWPDTLTWMSLP